jgi:hypothetical protein
MKCTTITLATFALVTSLLACGGTSSPAGAAAPTNAIGTGALDGKSYEVTLSLAGEQPRKDTLVFNGGKFESTACTGFGFPQWTEYTTSGDPSAVAFHVVTHHPSGDSIDWNGIVRGDSIEGKGAHMMNGKTDVETFSGGRKR